MFKVAWVRSKRSSVAAFTIVAGLGLLGNAGSPASAEDYKFQAGYRVTLNGITIGKATLAGSFDGSKYRIDGQGRLTGIAGALFDYSGSAAAAGRLHAGSPSPSAFSADASDGEKKTSVRMTLVHDSVRRVAFDPPLKPHQVNHPARVQVTEAHKRGVMDPMSALIAPGGFDGRNFDRRICDRTVPVFNGRERFDVQLEYKGIRTVQSNSSDGYSGPVLVCGARYRPISGHRSDKDEVKYMADRAVFEVMLAPLAGSDLLVPYRGSVTTPLGSAAIQATSFAASGALRTRAAAYAE